MEISQSDANRRRIASKTQVGGGKRKSTPLQKVILSRSEPGIKRVLWVPGGGAWSGRKRDASYLWPPYDIK